MFARDYRVVTWDQRGFGLSTNHHGLANPRTATDDLLAILDHLEIERAHVVGQSMGGWAAMGLAIAHGDRVRSLVLADTLGGIPIEDWWKTAAGVATRRPVQPSRALEPTSASANPERAHLYLQIGGLRRDPHADQTQMLRTMGDVTFADDAARRHSRIPTLFIVGTEDEIFPPESIAEGRGPGPGRPGRARSPAPATRPYFEQPGVWNPWWRASPGMPLTLDTLQAGMEFAQSACPPAVRRHARGPPCFRHAGSGHHWASNRLELKGEHDDLRRGVERSRA